MKKITFILLIFCVFTAKSQINLVPNPSFEDTIQCPDYLSASLFGIQNCQSWLNANMYSPDYFHTCGSATNCSAPSNSFGVQFPRTGNAYAGIYSTLPNEVAEYISIELSVTEGLVEGKPYYVGFYFSAGEAHLNLDRSLGMRFSDEKLDSTIHRFQFIPTYTIEDTNCIDTINYVDWILVSGIYLAKGDEKFITIGCFHEFNDRTSIISDSAWSQSCYSFIDDVFVIPIQDSTTYNCINNACVDPLDGTGLYDSLATCQAVCNATAIEENNTTKQLLKITDVLGRESKPKPNVPLFFRYDDGTVEKKIVIE